MWIFRPIFIDLGQTLCKLQSRSLRTHCENASSASARMCHFLSCLWSLDVIYGIWALGFGSPRSQLCYVQRCHQLPWQPYFWHELPQMSCYPISRGLDFPLSLDTFLDYSHDSTPGLEPKTSTSWRTRQNRQVSSLCAAIALVESCPTPATSSVGSCHFHSSLSRGAREL